MSKRVYISADYDATDGDREVVEMLTRWGKDNLHKVEFIDMAQVASGSVSDESDCRICDLKAEFNRQINASSAVIFVVGNKTKDRKAGSECQRSEDIKYRCFCTPYKKNSGGIMPCKVNSTQIATNNVGNINSFSYLRHEFEQAKRRKKKIIIVYNSTQRELSWLPSYMRGYENDAWPFWRRGKEVGNYDKLKKELGF